MMVGSNPKILVIYRQGGGCDFHRLITPFADFPKGVDIRFAKYGDKIDESVFDCDFVIINRHFLKGVDELNRLRHKYGFKLIMDYDDYWVLNYSHYLYKVWKEFGTTQSLIDHMHIADFVWVTNEQLYYKVKEEVPHTPVEIIENAINFNIPQFNIIKNHNPDIVKFCYASGASHKEDLQLITNLFRRLGGDGDWKKQGEFILGGYEDHPIFNDKVKMIKPCINYSIQNRLELDNYMNMYREPDVAIAPLVSNTFNKFKSNLKFLEAGAAAMPFICSNTLPYTKDLKMKDKGIKFCNNVSEWYKAFMYFVKNKEAIKDYGITNYLEVYENYNMNKINLKRHQILCTNYQRTVETIT